MASKAKAGAGVALAQATPYVQRFIEDESLRNNVRTAIDSASFAYKRLNGRKSPQKALLKDKKLQRSIQDAAFSLRDAQSALVGGPKRKKRRLGRLLVLALVGAGVAVGTSANLRTKVLDTLFGKEEEFEYTSTSPPR